MAVLVAEEPQKTFDDTQARQDKQHEFYQALRRLEGLGCRRQVLFYCLAEGMKN